VLVVEEGSLYPALYRMEAKGWIAAEWGKSENNRRAKFYSLTRTGRKQLEKETTLWERICRAITLVLETA
jgi:transcriptional regulator